MEKLISWFNLVPEQEQFCREALTELTTTLAANYSSFPEVKLQRVSTDEEADLSHFATGEDIASKYGTVFGSCSGSEAFACDARQRNPGAMWGAAIPGKWSLAWKPNNKYLIWHEFLHLLCALDCYDKNGRHKCEPNNCIMQYEPNEKNCNSTLILCSKVCNEIDKGDCGTGFANDE